MYVNNNRLAVLLKEISLMYRYLGPENRFRSTAYARASRMIRFLTMDITALKGQVMKQHIPGIGTSISQQIEEYIRTGSIKLHAVLKKQVPFELLDLLDLKGWGVATLKQISRQLRSQVKEELVTALKNGSIAGMPGFSEAKAKRLLRAIQFHQATGDRMPLYDAVRLGNDLVAWFKQLPGVEQVEVAGSVRRRKETIGDLDLVVACDDKWRRKIVSAFCSPAFASQVIAKGVSRASIIHRTSGRQVDVILVKPAEWGSGLVHFTGSREHNIHLRQLAKQAGYKLSEHGLFSVSDGSRLAGETEESIYHALGLQAMPPEMRENRGEFNLTAKRGIAGRSD